MTLAKLASFLACRACRAVRAPARMVVQQVNTTQEVAGIARPHQLNRHRSCDTARMETTETTPRTHEPRIGRSVSLDHAAQILGVSRRTIYNRIREGRLQTIRTLGGSQRVLLDSVQEIRSQS